MMVMNLAVPLIAICTVYMAFIQVIVSSEPAVTIVSQDYDAQWIADLHKNLNTQVPVPSMANYRLDQFTPNTNHESSQATVNEINSRFTATLQKGSKLQSAREPVTMLSSTVTIPASFVPAGGILSIYKQPGFPNAPPTIAYSALSNAGCQSSGAGNPSSQIFCSSTGFALVAYASSNCSAGSAVYVNATYLGPSGASCIPRTASPQSAVSAYGVGQITSSFTQLHCSGNLQSISGSLDTFKSNYCTVLTSINNGVVSNISMQSSCGGGIPSTIVFADGKCQVPQQVIYPPTVPTCQNDQGFNISSLSPVCLPSAPDINQPLPSLASGSIALPVIPSWQVPAASKGQLYGVLTLYSHPTTQCPVGSISPAPGTTPSVILVYLIGQCLTNDDGSKMKLTVSNGRVFRASGANCNNLVINGNATVGVCLSGGQFIMTTTDLSGYLNGFGQSMLTAQSALKYSPDNSTLYQGVFMAPNCNNNQTFSCNNGNPVVTVYRDNKCSSISFQFSSPSSLFCVKYTPLKPSASPTSMPTSITAIAVSFATVQTLSGITKAQLLQPSTKSAFTSAVAMSLSTPGAPQVPSSAINITSVVSTNSAFFRLSATGVSVSYTVNVIAESLGFTDGMQAFNTLKSNIQAAVSSHAFLSTLKTTGDANLVSVTDATVQVYSPAIVVTRTPHPTMPPTLQPTVQPSTTFEYYSEGPLWFQIVLPLALAIFVIALVTVSYFLFCHGGKSKGKADDSNDDEAAKAQSIEEEPMFEKPVPQQMPRSITYREYSDGRSEKPVVRSMLRSPEGTGSSQPRSPIDLRTNQSLSPSKGNPLRQPSGMLGRSPSSDSDYSPTRRNSNRSERVQDAVFSRRESFGMDDNRPQRQFSNLGGRSPPQQSSQRALNPHHGTLVTRTRPNGSEQMYSL